jgi:hypothetical protein
MIHRAVPTHEMREKLRLQGVLTLRDEGVQLALAGKTSLDEALRITHNDDAAEEPLTVVPPGHEGSTPSAATPVRPPEVAA